MKTILVVDDEPKIIQLARDFLEHAGFAVQTARDGRAALAAYRAERPDRVVLDLGLPHVDGLDVARALRRDSDVPIIMLTARAEETDELVGLELIRAGDLTLDMPRMRLTIGDVMEAAGRVAEGDYGARVAERGPPEVRVLARSFNAMTARLQQSDDERRAFLADVVHELRTPLTVIPGSLEGLIDGVYPRDDAHLLPILDETRLLARLIDDLRTLSLMEAGALPLHRQPTDPGTLAAETAASFRPQADAAGIVLSTVIGNDVPVIDVDPSRIRQVLENLIANALAHTPRGGAIEVACGVEPGGGAPRRVSIAVRDTGAGIAPEDLPHIFDRFFKSPDSRGSGLGLAIARDLVAAHGGEITARSEVGRGTTVVVALPAEGSG